LRENDTLEFCRQAGQKSINRLFTESEIRHLYTGWPKQTLDDLLKSLSPCSTEIGSERMWQERAVDDWLAERQPDDGRDKVLPGGKVRLGGPVDEGITRLPWLLLEAILATEGHEIDESKAMDHVYGDDDK